MKIKTMTSQELLKTDLLDILFENRNKQYGAYVLRKFYHVRLSESLFTTTAVILLIVFLFKPQYVKSVPPPILSADDSGLLVRTVDIPDKQIIEKLPTRKTSVPVSEIMYTHIRVSDKVTTTDVPDLSNLGKAIISNITREGIPSEALPLPPVPKENIPLEKPTAPAPFIPAYAAPEFPGGLTAWTQFLNRYLQAPESLGPNEKKSVMVRFFISKEGSISGLEVVQSAGPEFDQEVIRVLKKMPKWKPALQNGQPVATTYTQPVTFIGLEE